MDGNEAMAHEQTDAGEHDGELSAKAKHQPYRKDWMSDDQYECHQLLADIVGGFHHIQNKVKKYAFGIETSINSGWATYDFDQLTRLVVLAHDRAIRAEISSSGPRMFRLALWKRQRDGRMSERHPTMEKAIERIRQ